MSADPAVVQQEVDALRGSSPAELDVLRTTTAAKLRLHLDSLPEVANIPEAVAQIKTFIGALQARLDAIATLTKAAAPAPHGPLRDAVAADRAPPITVESPSAPAALFTPTAAVVYAPPDAAEPFSTKAALIVGALALAALLLLMRKS